MSDYNFTLPAGIPGYLTGNPNDPSLPAYLSQAMQEYQNGLPNPASSQLPSYLSYAMANPQAPQDQTPVSQAMAPPASPQTPVSAAMQAPQGPDMSPIQAMFQRQATDPNMSMSNGLIAAGSAMLGADNLQKGLGAAGAAFGNAYDSTLNQQRELNTPKVTPLADGSFSMVQLPGGQPQVMPNAQVQQFLLGKQQLINQAGLNKAIVTQNLKSQAQQAQDDRARATEYQAKLTQTDQALAANQRAIETATQQANDPSAFPRLAAAFPQLAQTIGSTSAQGNLTIQRATVDASLVQDALKKGAITDQQAGFLNSDVPAPTADRQKVIIPWLRQQGEILQKIRDFQASQVNKANPAPPTGFATSGTSNVGGGVLSNGGPVRGNAMSYIQ